METVCSLPCSIGQLAVVAKTGELPRVLWSLRETVIIAASSSVQYTVGASSEQC